MHMVYPTSSVFDDLSNGGSPEDVIVLLFMLWTVKVDSLTFCAYDVHFLVLVLRVKETKINSTREIMSKVMNLLL